MRKNRLSLRNLLLEESPPEKSLAQQYLESKGFRFVDESGQQIGTAAVVDAPPLPAPAAETAEEARLAFMEKFAQVQAWFESKRALGASLSAGLLNANSEDLNGLNALASEAISNDGDSKYPLYQIAAAGLVVPPNWEIDLLNRGINALIAAAEIYTLRGYSSSYKEVGGKYLLAAPGVIELIEYAYEHGVVEDYLSSEKVKPPEAPTVPIDPSKVPVIRENFSPQASKRFRYSLMNILNESITPELVAALKPVLGDEIMNLPGDLAEKLFIKMLRNPSVEEGSLLDGILKKIKSVAEETGADLIDEAELKTFITKNASEIFDSNTIAEYTQSIKDEAIKQAVRKARNDLISPEAPESSLIERLILDLEEFYKSIFGADASVTDLDKAVVKNALKAAFEDESLDSAQRMAIISSKLSPWASQIDALRESLRTVTSIGTPERASEAAVEIINGIETLVRDGFSRSGISASYSDIGFEMVDIEGNRFPGILRDVKVSREIQPDLAGGGTGAGESLGIAVYKPVLECFDYRTGQPRFVRIENYLDGLKEATSGFVTKTSTANDAFQSALDTAQRQLSSELDANLASKSPDEWAAFMNKAIDDAGSGSPLSKPISAVKKAANVPTSTASIVIRNLGREFKAKWQEVTTKQAKELGKDLAKSAAEFVFRARTLFLMLVLVLDYKMTDWSNDLYIVRFANKAILAEYQNFFIACSQEKDLKVKADQALEIANKIVSVYSTPSLFGDEASPMPPPEAAINSAASKWQTIHENILAYHTKLVAAMAASASGGSAVQQESQMKLRALIREALVQDLISSKWR